MPPLKEQRKPTGQFWRADVQCLKIWSHNGPNCNMDLSTAEHFIRHQLSWLLSPYMCRLIHSEIAVKHMSDPLQKSLETWLSVWQEVSFVPISAFLDCINAFSRQTICVLEVMWPILMQLHLRCESSFTSDSPYTLVVQQQHEIC